MHLLIVSMCVILKVKLAMEIFGWFRQSIFKMKWMRCKNDLINDGDIPRAASVLK